VCHLIKPVPVALICCQIGQHNNKRNSTPKIEPLTVLHRVYTLLVLDPVSNAKVLRIESKSHPISNAKENDRNVFIMAFG
jgi:hypothetical protein